MSNFVLVDRPERSVTVLTLNRPEALNAISTGEQAGELAEALAAADRDPGVRAVVLTGAGKAFCAGGDLRAMRDGTGMFSKRPLDVRDSYRNGIQRIPLLLMSASVPVIAAVHGVAFGGGLQVALGADIRLLAPDAQMSVMEVKWGLVPDMAGVVLLRGLLRDDVARELCFTGRVVAADEAVALGLATRCCADPLAEARAMAAAIAQRSPSAVRAAKRLLNQAQRTLDGSAAELLQAESDEQAAIIGGPNQVEAVRANLEGRAPKFID